MDDKLDQDSRRVLVGYFMCNSSKRLAAMNEEIGSLHKNNTWVLTELPDGMKLLKCKWIYKKEGIYDVEPVRWKAHLVVKGFERKEGIDFDELCLLWLHIFGLELEQLDVKTAFLHGDLEEKIFMTQPEGFVAPGKEHLICRLQKSLYDLKQAPRQWYKRFYSFMVAHAYFRSKYDSCVYFKQFPNGSSIYLLLYVDDMLIASYDKALINVLKSQLSHEFEMKDLGPTKKILSMEIQRDRKAGKLFLSQKKVLDRYNLSNCKPVPTPFASHFKLSLSRCPVNENDKDYMSCVPHGSAVGNLTYAMICTRPELAHAVSVVSRFMHNPSKEHWNAVKWILHYLKGTSSFGLMFDKSKVKSNDILGCVDSDYVGLFLVISSHYVARVSFGKLFLNLTTLSTIEAEYISTTEDVNTIYCDSQSAIQLAKNDTVHTKAKYIDVKHHFIRDIVAEGQAIVGKIHIGDNPPDMLTKSLSDIKFKQAPQQPAAMFACVAPPLSQQHPITPAWALPVQHRPPPTSVSTDWITDSGASYHTTPHTNILSSIRPPHPSCPSSIMVGNGPCLPVTSVGTAGTHGLFRLRNVLVAPHMVHNILSIRQFTTDNSCSVEFDPSGLIVKDSTSQRPLLRCDSTYPLYTLRLPPSTAPPSTSTSTSLSSSAAFATTTSSTTWHRRLGHPCRDALAQLSRSAGISCPRATDEHLCHECQLGRHVRLPFPTSHAAHIFDLIHCDLWTSPVLSISSYKYYLVVLDDFSHYYWTFPLRTKSDAFSTILHFFTWVSTQFGLTIKAVQCDNGHEFDNNTSRSFFLSRGVQLRMSCPYTSSQNGKAERMIRTTYDVMHTLLLHTATYLLNRLPSTTSPAPTPHHALFGTPPHYDHLHVFGCACYPNISATVPHKLAPHSTRCVFLGYSPDHKEYRCFNLTSHRMLISRHVAFDESDLPFSTTSTPASDHKLEALSSLVSLATRRGTWYRIHLVAMWSLASGSGRISGELMAPWIATRLTGFSVASPSAPAWTMMRLDRYKARWRPGIDYDETFSPVVKPATVRTVLSLAFSSS
ncbi:hypothetical protein U9M48_030931 [Paspalum notatum var. saurae]|uniref:Integrase catalytic domain-containing protein n=1 Tax=Paspalum notatum var. saurae TaxID=547442 RepID=A0AAQ3X2T1_PASNO